MKSTLFIFGSALVLLGSGCSGVTSKPVTASPTTSVSPLATTTIVTYKNPDHQFSLTYPDTLNIDAVSSTDVGMKGYFALHLTAKNGDEMQLYVNPGGHGDPCMDPEHPQNTPHRISRRIAGINAKGQSCFDQTTETFSFVHGADAYDIILQGIPSQQNIFHTVLDTMTFTPHP